MQRPEDTDLLIDIDLPSAPLAQNSFTDKSTAAQGWEACLEDAKDMTRYPRIPVIEGPFANDEEMLAAKAKGNYNIVNPFQRPTGPTHQHITLLQNLHDHGQPVDQIAHFLVVSFPDLMRGWRTGTEYDRRIQIHGLVSIWISQWAPRFAEDGSVIGGNGDGGRVVKMNEHRDRKR